MAMLKTDSDTQVDTVPIPVTAGQSAFEYSSQATLAISAARGHAVAGHRTVDVDKVGNQIGYGTAFGDEMPNGVFSPTGIDASHLRVAA